MTNPAALMELANRIKEAIDTNMMDGTARRTLHKLADELRTAASGVGRITPEQEAADWANDDGGSIIDPREETPSPLGAEARDAVTLADINAAFNNEIDRVSTLEFNSNEICRAFYRNLLKRINPDWGPAMQEAALRARDD